MLIEGFEDYEIYENGNIRSLKSNKILKPRLDSKGNYLILGLYKDGKQYTKYVHRLVAENFIPNPQNKMEVNHINGNKTDNRVENLEWATRSENVKHAIITGLNPIRRNHMTKMNEKGNITNKLAKSKPIIAIDLKTNKMKLFTSAKDAERKTGISRASIVQCIRGRYHTAGGYRWKYQNDGGK